MIIAVDTMGGDNAPKAQIDSSIDAINEYDIDIVLFGDKETIEKYLSGKTYNSEKLSIVHCLENIENDEKPVMAIKKKKNSPMVLACNMLNNKEIDAFVSSGSTGALLTAGMLITGKIEGILRPALTIVYPKSKGGAVLLDVGANAQCQSEYINQFGYMGYVYAKAILNNENPKVGLINIGTEEKKGSQVYIDAHKLLKENTKINFIGNVEARDIPTTEADVLVCDGFTGNIVLKLTEGVAMSLLKMIKTNLMSNLRSKIGAMLAKPALKNLKNSLDYEEYGGAILLGINSIVIKAHGSSNAKAFKNAIKQAKILHDKNIINTIKEFASMDKLEQKQE